MTENFINDFHNNFKLSDFITPDKKRIKNFHNNIKVNGRIYLK